MEAHQAHLTIPIPRISTSSPTFAPIAHPRMQRERVAHYHFRNPCLGNTGHPARKSFLWLDVVPRTSSKTWGKVDGKLESDLEMNIRSPAAGPNVDVLLESSSISNGTSVVVSCTSTCRTRKLATKISLSRCRGCSIRVSDM